MLVCQCAHILYIPFSSGYGAILVVTRISSSFLFFFVWSIIPCNEIQNIFYYWSMFVEHQFGSVRKKTSWALALLCLWLLLLLLLLSPVQSLLHSRHVCKYWVISRAFCTEFNVNNMCAWCAFISIRWALASLISASQRGICVLLSPTTTTTTSPHMIFFIWGLFLFIITIITAALRMAIYKFTNSLPLVLCNELAIFTLYFTCERFLFWFLLLLFFFYFSSVHRVSCVLVTLHVRHDVK